MRVLSLFSGIDAVSVAWKPLGWEVVAFSEIEPFPCKVLAHHYPDVPNLGDITKITESDIQALGHIDLVVFGSPCQDLSIAGIRKGLDGNRSGLFFTAIQIVRWSKARFALWENVPGAFSSNKGNDFAAVVREMGRSSVSPTVPSAGWGTEGVALGEKALVEWATLDAQWFGVAQRRRRCFALADFGNWQDRPPILLEQQSVRGNPAPSRKKGKEVTEIAGTLSANGGGTTRPAGNANELDFCVTTHRMVAFGEYVDDDAAGSLKQRDYKDATDLISYGTKTDVHAVAFNWQGSAQQGASVSENVTPTLDKSKVHAVATTFKVRGGCEGGGKGYLGSEDAAFTLSTNQDRHLFYEMQVRRLTPLECHRLQGFPDHFLHQVKGATDSAMYKALGNSMAVPVMRWIGQRIKDAITAQELLTNPLP